MARAHDPHRGPQVAPSPRLVPSGPLSHAAATYHEPVPSDPDPGPPASTGEAPAFDSKHFRSVLGHFPTGVTIVTGLDEGRPAGFTIGSFTSISLDPPLVGFFPMVDSDTWAAMAPVRQLLRQRAPRRPGRPVLAIRQDRRRRRPFDDVAWNPSPTGCPILDGVGAWIDCRMVESIELGDHYLVVGGVVALDHHAQRARPARVLQGRARRVLVVELIAGTTDRPPRCLGDRPGTSGSFAGAFSPTHRRTSIESFQPPRRTPEARAWRSAVALLAFVRADCRPVRRAPTADQVQAPLPAATDLELPRDVRRQADHSAAVESGGLGCRSRRPATASRGRIRTR